MPELDPLGFAAGSPGAKLDAGKSPVRAGLLEYFPRACMAVADHSARGARKYCWNGWERVPNGIERYGDAMARHICLAAIEGPDDSAWPGESVLHATAETWNALARLELILREQGKAETAECQQSPLIERRSTPASPLWRRITATFQAQLARLGSLGHRYTTPSTARSV